MRFTEVNNRSCPNYLDGWQAHYIVPLESLHCADLQLMLRCAKRGGLAIDDYEANGMLLPSTERAALQSGLPMHHGPHRRYSRAVIGRLRFLNRIIGQELCPIRDADFAAQLLAAVIRPIKQSLGTVNPDAVVRTIDEIVLPGSNAIVCAEIARLKAEGRFARTADH